MIVDVKLKESRFEWSPIAKDFQNVRRILEPAQLATKNWYERYGQFKMTVNPDSNELKKYSDEYQKIRLHEMDLGIDYIRKKSGSFSLMVLGPFSNRLKVRQIEELFDSLDVKIQHTSTGKEFCKSIDRMNAVQIGKVALDFSARDTSGNLVSLSSLKGNIYYWIFFASWCGPCSDENQYVVKTYQKFKTKNFDILVISLDDESRKEKWINAIKEDQLECLQVSDLKGWQSEIAELYHIRGVPQNFLLNPEGVIIVSNLSGSGTKKSNSFGVAFL